MIRHPPLNVSGLLAGVYVLVRCSGHSIHPHQPCTCTVGLVPYFAGLLFLVVLYIGYVEVVPNVQVFWTRRAGHRV